MGTYTVWLLTTESVCNSMVLNEVFSFTCNFVLSLLQERDSSMLALNHI